MDEMQGGGLGVCFLHHHLLPAGWNPKASHGARKGIFENTTYAAQTSFFFYKSVLSETRQVISLMQTAEIFCLKTHERVNEFHFIDLTEDWFCRSSASRSCTFPGGSQASFPHGGRLSGMKWHTEGRISRCMYEDHDRTETSVMVDRKKFLWQFRRRDSIDKQVSWSVNITDTIQLPKDHIYSRDALRLLGSYMK